MALVDTTTPSAFLLLNCPLAWLTCTCVRMVPFNVSRWLSLAQTQRKQKGIQGGLFHKTSVDLLMPVLTPSRQPIVGLVAISPDPAAWAHVHSDGLLKGGVQLVPLGAPKDTHSKDHPHVVRNFYLSFVSSLGFRGSLA